MDLRICQAIAERQLLMFGYGDAVRTVEPHLYGRTTAGHEAVSCWMRAGWSRQDPEGGWRLFRLDAVSNLQILPEQFAGPRTGFNPADPHFDEIFCRVLGPEAASSGATQRPGTPASEEG